MESFTVQVFPVARPDEWRAFCESAATGQRADSHRQMLRRLGVKREHIYLAGPQTMVLVWEGLDQKEVGQKMADMLENPQSEHERYLATYVIPVVHGMDPSMGAPPEVEQIVTIET